MTTLTQKSQVTIPKEIRNILRIGPGDEIEFNIKGNKVLLKRKSKELPFEKWRGYLGKLRTKELMEEIR